MNIELVFSLFILYKTTDIQPATQFFGASTKIRYSTERQTKCSICVFDVFAVDTAG